MIITIRLQTENAAFTDNPSELRDILAEAIALVLGETRSATLRDSNGNTVGSVTVKGGR